MARLLPHREHALRSRRFRGHALAQSVAAAGVWIMGFGAVVAVGAGRTALGGAIALAGAGAIAVGFGAAQLALHGAGSGATAADPVEGT